MSAWGQEWTRHGEGPGIPHRWPNDPGKTTDIGSWITMTLSGKAGLWVPWKLRQ